MKAAKQIALTKVIRKLARQGETKYSANNISATGVDLGPAWYPPGNIPAVGIFVPAISQVSQGAGDFQRVGNIIEPKSCSVSLKMGYNPTDLSANNIYAVVWYGVSKTGKTWENQNPVNSPAFLDLGNGTNVAWAGLRNQLAYPTDKKQFTLKRKVFRLSKTAGAQNNDVNPPTAQGGSYATSNGYNCVSTLLKFKPPTHLKYNLGTDVYPTNYAPFYVIGFCHADGSALTDADRNLITVASRTHLYFKDL